MEKLPKGIVKLPDGKYAGLKRKGYYRVWTVSDTPEEAFEKQQICMIKHYWLKAQNHYDLLKKKYPKKYENISLPEVALIYDYIKE